MMGPGKFPERTPSDPEPTGRDILIGTGVLLHPELVRVVQGRAIRHITAGSGQPICVWVPACAGEKGYSVAISLLEYPSEKRANAPVKVFVNDFDDAALATGRADVYPSDKVPEIVLQHPLRFMRPFNGNCKGHFTSAAAVRVCRAGCVRRSLVYQAGPDRMASRPKAFQGTFAQ